MKQFKATKSPEHSDIRNGSGPAPEARVLTGVRVVVTRAREQAAELTAALETLGADVLAIPVIAVRPPPDTGALDAAARNVAAYDWLVFTSVNGVRFFFDALARVHIDSQAFIRAGVKIAAVGPQTAQAVRERGAAVELTPESFSSEELLQALRLHGELAGVRFLLARADVADSALPEALFKAGASVDALTAYITELEREAGRPGLAKLRADGAQFITFTSGSTVRAFLELFGSAAAAANLRARWISIGPQTSAAIREAGFPVHAEAAPHTVAGLVEAVRTCKKIT